MLDNPAMARAIRTALDDANLTQRGIAEHFGVTEQAVSGWLRTGKIDKRKIPRLAKLTGKPLSHFGMDIGEEPSQVERLDVAKLASLIETVESAAIIANRVLSPNAKARIVASLYEADQVPAAVEAALASILASMEPASVEPTSS